MLLEDIILEAFRSLERKNISFIQEEQVRLAIKESHQILDRNFSIGLKSLIEKGLLTQNQHKQYETAKIECPKESLTEVSSTISQEHLQSQEVNSISSQVPVVASSINVDEDQEMDIQEEVKRQDQSNEDLHDEEIEEHAELLLKIIMRCRQAKITAEQSVQTQIQSQQLQAFESSQINTQESQNSWEVNSSKNVKKRGRPRKTFKASHQSNQDETDQVEPNYSQENDLQKLLSQDSSDGSQQRGSLQEESESNNQDSCFKEQAYKRQCKKMNTDRQLCSYQSDHHQLWTNGHQDFPKRLTRNQQTKIQCTNKAKHHCSDSCQGNQQ